MTTFVIVAVGEFCGSDGARGPVSLPEFPGTKAAGFYTTRVVCAPDRARAAERAADSIHEELLMALGRQKAVYSLRIETCEELTDPPRDVPRGFSFYTDD